MSRKLAPTGTAIPTRAVTPKPRRKDYCMTGNPLPFIQTLSKTNRAVIIAYRKGYRIVDGEPQSPTGKTLKTTFQKGIDYRRPRFSVNVNGEKQNAYVHKLAAFQKFGIAMFEAGVQVRHLDGDTMNNQAENIAIGTASDNMMDKAPKERTRLAINASNNLRKLNDRQILEARKLRESGWSYKQLMEKYQIKHKSTIHHILNNDYVTKKAG